MMRAWLALVVAAACTGSATRPSGSATEQEQARGTGASGSRTCPKPAWPGGGACHDEADCNCPPHSPCECAPMPRRTPYLGNAHGCGVGMVEVVRGGSPNCEPGCATTGCKPDERCESSGRCEPVACTAGWQCPPGATCKPGRTSDEHGCVLAACRADDDCACGTYCVVGRCRAQPGSCVSALPLP